MIRKITLHNYLVFLFFFLYSFSYAQTTIYATNISSEERVGTSANAIDANLTSKAEVRASSGIALGIGAYSGHLELEFATPLAANMSSFIKIDTEDDLLSNLLGGSLANLLSDISGVLLMGNQEFAVEVKNGGSTVLQGDSGIYGSLSTENLKVVTDVNNDYFLALAPNLTFNRVRVTNRVGSLIGLNNTRDLGVYGAFHTQGNNDCGQPSYTSFSGDGLTLDLLNIGGAGVTDPHLALDGDLNTFSQLSLGIMGVAASIEQTIYFDATAELDDNYYVNLAINPALLQLGIANNIEIIAQNGASAPVFSQNLASLLDADALGLLQNNNMATIGFNPGVPVDRITIRMSSLLNVALDQQIRIHDVFSAPPPPTITAESQNQTICNGSTANLVAEVQNANNVELRWYDAATNGTLLATLNSGETYTTPILSSNTTYYVAAAEVGCPEESPRVAITVNVVNIPTADDITVLGNENPICSSNPVVLVPSSTIDGTFSWFFDANRASPISDGLVAGGATYNIDANGVLTITGLSEAGSPYTFYTDVAHATAGCQNIAGDLKMTVVDIVDSNASASIASDVNISTNDLENIFNGNPTMNLTGAVSGDVNPGDEINLAINGMLYSGTIGTDLNFNIAVDGTDLAFDVDSVIETFISGAVCTVTDAITINLPELLINNAVQVFCAADIPTAGDIEVDGSDTVLFDSLSAIAQIDASTPLIDGDVYFAGILNVPVSILARIRIDIELLDVAPPTTIIVDQVVCDDADATISDIMVNETNVVFFDSMIGGSILDPDQPLIDGGVYFVATVNMGCESSVRLQINIIMGDNEPITLNGDTEDVCQNREYTYRTESNKENYVWTVSGGTIIEGGRSTDDFATVVWNELQDTSIHVGYHDDQSCEPDKTLVLDVAVISCGEVLGEEFCLFVYNEFSPNNDGFNDFFTVKCIEDYTSTLKVYNRNGNLVFRVKNYQNNWNGVANVGGILNSGQHLPSGTYYYVIDIPELERNLVGWLQLAR